MCTPSLIRRLLARFIDQVVLSVFWIPTFLQLFADWIRGGPPGLMSLDLRWVFFAAGSGFLYRVLFYKFFGATIGKWLLSLRLISTSGLPAVGLSWPQALLRVTADGLSLFFGLGLFSLALWRFDRTHVSDRLAETRVVYLCSDLEMDNMPAPSRHLFWGAVLFLYFSISSFSSVSHLLKNARLSGYRLQVQVWDLAGY